jgi:dTDP-glucose pyrophosphorylase
MTNILPKLLIKLVNSMNKNVHLVMPMGGKGSRFSQMGYDKPKPLIEINDRPFFYWATQSIRKFVGLRSLTFVVLQEHVDHFNIDKVISSYFPEANIIVIPHVLDGAVLTCLEGVKNIKDDAPIIFNDCDHIFYCPSFYDFCNKGDFDKINGLLLTFTSNDPKFSFLEVDDSGNVIRTVEKVAISDKAICGAYFFRNRFNFEDAAKKYLNICNYSEYFVSGVFNVLVGEGKIVRSFNVDAHVPFGTPEEYEKAKGSEWFGVIK